MVSSSNPPNSDIVLAALAILESADQIRVANLLGQELSSEQIHLLLHHPQVNASNSSFCLKTEFAAEILQQLEHENLSLYRELHERALDILEMNLRAGETTTEKNLLAVFTRLADRLIKDSP